MVFVCSFSFAKLKNFLALDWLFIPFCKGCGFSCNVGDFSLVWELRVLEMSGISTDPKWKLLRNSKYGLIELCKNSI